jgi:hypothetical protein
LINSCQARRLLRGRGECADKEKCEAGWRHGTGRPYFESKRNITNVTPVDQFRMVVLDQKAYVSARRG